MRKIPTIKIVLLSNDSLSVKVTIPGTTKYKFKTFGIKINRSQWDKKMGLCKKGHKDADLINRNIFAEKNRLIDLFEMDLKENIAFTEQHISNRIEGLEYDPKDFYEFSRSQIEKRNYKPGTKRSYNSEVTKIEKYTPTLLLSQINYSFLQGYEQYMRQELSNASNTVWKSLKFINTMIIAAIKMEIISKNPFKEYDRGNYKQGIPVYLEWPEVQKLHDAVVNKPMRESTRLVGYYSLLSYYSGLRYGDAVNFDYNTHVIEDASGLRLVLKTEKMGETVSIAFTKYIAEIVAYIRDKPISTTNQEFNRSLKIIQGIAGITKDISSHTGRHSFAMHCSELDMSMDDVQKLLGHGNKKSTSVYFRIKDRRLDSAMSKWNE